jgi:ectoine hydroxylase-related dioxygenase (phytanoyl-CoA dioxygenase family)
MCIPTTHPNRFGRTLMNASLKTELPVRSTPRASDQELKESFADNGFVVLEGIIDRPRLAALSAQIVGEFRRSSESGRLFSGGGTVSGHLNCFPGAAARFVYEALEEQGILDLVKGLSTVPLRAPNVGCNLNLPGSIAQNVHVDGYAARPFLVVNIAAVDTDLTNGAMEILAHSQRKDYKLWQILLARPERLRLCMKQGDVVIRTSALWHRGMPNNSQQPRPMLALTWEDGGSPLSDPYQANVGQITFFPNRFRTDWAGRLRERMFVAAPRLSTALRAARSLLEP